MCKQHRPSFFLDKYVRTSHQGTLHTFPHHTTNSVSGESRLQWRQGNDNWQSTSTHKHGTHDKKTMNDKTHMQNLAKDGDILSYWVYS